MSTGENQPLLSSPLPSASYLPTSTSDIREDKFTIPTPTGPTYCDLGFMWFTVATTGVILFTGTLWWILFQAESSLFLWHPTCMSFALVFVTEGVLLLQRTETVEQKEEGAHTHKWFQMLGFLSAICGFTVIVSNKIINNKEHFYSAHGKAGLTTVCLLAVQGSFGFVMLVFPSALGGVRQARAMYKYHRMSGYFGLFLIWLTALGGTQASWTLSQFDHVWVWLLAVSLVAVGVGLRTRASKMKIK
uniref:Cytochrome b561 n=1 Tax=Anthurium amnicola TaxID=1678845 RepID=A0A1D1XQU1_9ARAE